MKALSTFKFADENSRENALAAMHPDRPAAFLIMGPAGSGKTKLAGFIFRRVFNFAPLAVGVDSPEKMFRRVRIAADLGFLFLDDIGWRVACDPELLGFLTSETVQLRRRFARAACAVKNNCLTVITTSCKEGPPEDLRIRCRVITLAARRGTCAGRSVHRSQR